MNIKIERKKLILVLEKTASKIQASLAEPEKAPDKVEYKFDSKAWKEACDLYRNNQIQYLESCLKSIKDQLGKDTDPAIQLPYSATSIKCPIRSDYIVGPKTERHDAYYNQRNDPQYQKQQSLYWIAGRLTLLRLSDEAFITIRDKSDDFRWFTTLGINNEFSKSIAELEKEVSEKPVGDTPAKTSRRRRDPVVK